MSSKREKPAPTTTTSSLSSPPPSSSSAPTTTTTTSAKAATMTKKTKKATTTTTTTTTTTKPRRGSRGNGTPRAPPDRRAPGTKPLPRRQIAGDLSEMGIEREAVRRLLARRERKVDSTTYPVDGKPENKGKLPGGYVQLWLGASFRWVVYDPQWGLPAGLSAAERRAAQRWAVFEPGNRYVLEYNTGSGSVRRRLVAPGELDGRTIKYPSGGPEVVDVLGMEEGSGGRAAVGGKGKGRKRKAEADGAERG